jgi:hypothetical protein
MSKKEAPMKRSAYAAALALTIALAPGSARAHVGSGSGGAGFWEGVIVIGAITLGALVIVPATYDIVQGARARPPDGGWAIAQGVGGGLVVGIVAAKIGGDLEHEDGGLRAHTAKNDGTWAGLTALLAVGAAFGGYGAGAMIDRDAPAAGPIGATVGATGIATARALGTVAGLPHGPATSLVQAALTLPGIGAGVYWATDARDRTERNLALSLAGVSAVVMIHGVIDAAIYRPPAMETKAAPRTSLMVAPTWLERGAGVTIGGTF